MYTLDSSFHLLCFILCSNEWCSLLCFILCSNEWCSAQLRLNTMSLAQRQANG